MKLSKSLIRKFKRPGRPVTDLWIPPKVDIDNLPEIDDPENALRNIRYAQDTFVIPRGEKGGEPFLLVSWMWLAEWQLFGRLNSDGTRQYEKVFVFIPKKNAKSPWLARMGLHMLMFDNEYEPVVLTAASTFEQSKHVWDPMTHAIRKSMGHDMKGNPQVVWPWLSKWLKIYSAKPERIECYAQNLGSCHRMTGDVNAKQGADPTCILIDEIGEWKGRKGHELYSTLTSFSTDARRQPVTIIATTANVYDPESVYQAIKDEAFDAMLHPDAPEYRHILPIMYFPSAEEEKTIRDGVFPSDELIKRLNPGYDEVMPFDRIKRKLLLALRSKNEQLRRDALRFRLNLDISSIFNWMPADLWAKCNFGAPDIDCSGRNWFVGIDLAPIRDLSSFVAISAPTEPGEKVQIFVKAYITRDQLEIAEGKKKQKTQDGKNAALSADSASYSIWSKSGVLTVVEGKVLNDDDLIKDLLDFFRWRDGSGKLGRKCGAIIYDPNQSKQCVEDLTAAGYGAKIMPYSNTYANYNGPCGFLMKLAINESVNHGGNPVLRHHMNNLMMKTNEQGEIKPIKKSKGERNDVACALLLAVLGLFSYRGKTGRGNILI